MARKRGQHHGDLRAALEEAALELVMERGPRGFTLAEVSRRAGVSAAAPYNHFADKDALLMALTMRAFVEQRERFAVAMEGAATPAEALTSFAAAYVDFAHDRRGLFLLASSADELKERDVEVRSLGDELFVSVSEQVAKLVGSGPQTTRLTFAVGASIHGYAALLTAGAFDQQPQPIDFARDGAVASVTALLGDALGADPRTG